MKDIRRSIFSDRRDSEDRRKQNLPMPAGLDRRKDMRRSKQFKAQPWWLNTDYAVELISEKRLREEAASIQQQRRKAKKTD